MVDSRVVVTVATVPIPAAELRSGDLAALSLGGPIYKIGSAWKTTANGRDAIAVETWEYVRDVEGRRSRERSEVYLGLDHTCWRVPAK